MAEYRDEQINIFGDSADYSAFLDKFKGKKTTDDCYTPPLVYDAVADFVVSEYGRDRADFVRPFYPGGDFETFPYRDGAVVVDNPPFSILTAIIEFYCKRGIPFFLFAPTLTLFTAPACDVSYLSVGVSVTYANGAKVNTSFVTNLERVKLRTAPALYRAIDAAERETQTATRGQALPKYAYPDHVVTSAMLARWSKYGVDFSVEKDDALYIGALDMQKAVKKKIFGGGYLISERAAAERAAAEQAAAEQAAAEQWQLSERELALVAKLSGTAPPGDVNQQDFFRDPERSQA